VDFGAGQSLIVSHDLPVVAQVTECPYLALILSFDVGILRSVGDEIETPAPRTRASVPDVGLIDDRTIEALRRHVSLSGDPAEARILGPLVLTEIHFRLFRAPHAGMLRDLVRPNSIASQIHSAVKWDRGSGVRFRAGLANRYNLYITWGHACECQGHTLSAVWVYPMTGRTTRWVTRYARLLVAYPRVHRERFAQGMCESFEAQLAQRTRAEARVALAVFLVRTALQTVFLGALERLRVPPTIGGRRHESFGRGHGLLARSAAEAWRSLRRSPVWTATVVLLLGLGIGSVTTMAAVVYTVVVQPLPYPAPEAMVRVGALREGRPGLGSISGPNFRDVATDASALTLAASTTSTVSVRVGDSLAESTRGAYVSGNFFTVLGVPPHLGRALDVRDDRLDGTPVAVISHRLWQSRLGGTADAVGRALQISGRAVTVVGVMGHDFHPPEALRLRDVEVWLPLAGAPLPVAERGLSFLDMVGRLRPEASLTSAEAELASIGQGLIAQHRFRPRAFAGLDAERLHDVTVAGQRPRTLLLLGAGLLLLVITVLNTTLLTLARAVARRSDVRVRRALGASRTRLAAGEAWQVAWLSAAGMIVGMGVAAWALSAMRRWAPLELPRIPELGLTPEVAAIALGLGVITWLVVAVVPVTHALRTNSNVAVNARGVVAGHSGRLRGALVIAQTAVAVILVCSAVVLGRSLYTFSGTDVGFDPRHLTVMSLRMTDEAEPRGPLDTRPVSRVLERVSTLPGLVSASVTTGAPFTPGGWETYIVPDSGEPLSDEDRARMRVGLHQSSAGHLTTLGADIVAGRDIATTDVVGAEPVVVVSQALASRFWPDGDALGAHLVVGGDGTFTQRRIAGIVDPPRHASRREDAGWHVYIPLEQFPPASDVDVIVRSAGSDVGSALRAVVSTEAPQATVLRQTTMATLMGRELVEPRFLAGLFGGFALVATVLCAAGLAGTLAFSTRLRRPEIAVRLAMGAGQGQVVWGVLRHAFALVGAGVVVGLTAAVVLGQSLEAFLFGTTALDIGTVAATVLLIAAASTLAIWGPARSAALVDPATTLRGE
jgi:predicted permease